jgi:hypothetical protein
MMTHSSTFFLPLSAIFVGEDENDFSRFLGREGLVGPGKLVVSTRTSLPKMAKPHTCFGMSFTLVCKNGAPIENMLAHSPTFPFTIDHTSKDGMISEDLKGILLALDRRHRVRHLRLLPVQNLQRLVVAIDEEFPFLEYLIVYY